MSFALFLPGMLRTIVKPLNFVQTQCLRTASPILSKTHQKVPDYSKLLSCYNHQNIFVAVGRTFPIAARNLSISPLKATNKTCKDGKQSKPKKCPGREVYVQQNCENNKDLADYSKIFHFRHLVNIGLLPVIPLALIVNSAATDFLFVIFFFIHNHYAFECLLNDYMNVKNLGRILAKFCQIMGAVVSLTTLVGLVNVIQNDIGVAQTFLCVWKVGKKDIQDESDRIQQEKEAPGAEE